MLQPPYLAVCSCRRSWYPPGHGDIYNSLKRSGLLERFLEEGKEFIFISNIDNLGATVDLGEGKDWETKYCTTTIFSVLTCISV